MEKNQVNSKDMIKFVHHILNENNHFNMVIRVPERCNGQYIEVNDLSETNDNPSISCKYSNIYIVDYQVIITLRKYTAFSKNEDGKWNGGKHYKVIYNGLETPVTLEEFTEIYNAMIGKKIEMDEASNKYYDKTNLAVFNFVVGKDDLM